MKEYTATYLLSSSIASQLDELTLSVLPDWDRVAIKTYPKHLLADLFKHRGMLLVDTKGYETFCWDGEPLFRMSPIQCEMVGGKFVARRSVTMLKEK